jgi:hypothetical protein
MIYKRGCDKKGRNSTCSKCSERGSCGVYWYKFTWNGKLIRESTKQGNDKVARQMESAHRTSLAKGEVGIRERKVPTLKEFCTNRVEPWARSTFETTCRKNWTWYRTGIRALTGYKPLANAQLDEIAGELASDFAAHRLRLEMQVATANNSLRVLRRILNLAVEWGVLVTAPKIKVLPGERRRERVITPEEEAKYLAAAPEPLATIATVLADTGMRPEEAQWPQWGVACNTRQDIGGPQGHSYDSARPSGA